MARTANDPLRIGVVGGGPAGSLFALYALHYAQRAGRELALTIYEGKDFRSRGPVGCNMCAGLIPAQVLRQLGELQLPLPPELFLGTIRQYALHTSAGIVAATQPDPSAQVLSVYRGAGPCGGPAIGLLSFDEFLLDAAVARGAVLRRTSVEAIQRNRPVELLSAGQRERYDLVVLAAGVNGHALSLDGFAYQPPPTGEMCQFELYLGEELVRRRLGDAVHIFLTSDEVAACGMLIPKGPYVTVSLLHARDGVRSLRAFLVTPEVVGMLGPQARPVCACRPRIALGPARGLADDGLVAVGDAGVTRLYKNGIGSALATARQAALTAVYRGCRREDFVDGYVPLCRAIQRDNWAGRLLFLQMPALKRWGPVASAHRELAATSERDAGAAALHARVLWGMFTGTYGYGELLRMAFRPDLVAQFGLAFGGALLRRWAGADLITSRELEHLPMVKAAQDEPVTCGSDERHCGSRESGPEWRRTPLPMVRSTATGGVPDPGANPEDRERTTAAVHD